MGRTCHGCHAPIDADHHNFPSGWQKCPLDHWDGCSGGIVEGKGTNGKDWRGCPDDYVGGADGGGASSEEENTDSDSVLKRSEITLDDIVDDTGENMLKQLYEKSQDKSGGETETVDVESDEDATGIVDTEEDILEQLEAANLLLKRQVADRAKLEKEERERKIAMLKAENLLLTNSMSGDNGGVRPKVTQKVSNPKNQKTLKPANSKSLKKRVPKSDDNLLPNNTSSRSHLTRNQLLSSEYRPEDASMYNGLDIKGIRKLPGMRSQVEGLIDQVQERAPSLDRRPSFVVVGDPSPGAMATPNVDPGYVYRYCEDGSLRKFRVNQTPSGGGAAALPLAQTGSSGGQKAKVVNFVEDDLDTSSDEDCEEEPKPGFMFRWRRDENGEKYFVEEEQVSQQKDSPDLEYKYVRDETTGRSYKRWVLRDDPSKELVPQWVIDPKTGKQVKMLVPSQPGSVKLKPAPVRSAGTRALPFGGRQETPATPTQSSIPVRNYTALQDDKQGKMPSIIQYARSCPVNWTSKITSDKLNMGLWSWSYVAELLAAGTGQAPSLQHGELEARLQHFLNVLEIALQPGNSADFDNQAWKVARLYAEKVQHKVDRGDTWLGFDYKYGTDSHPHELMAAEKELAPKPGRKLKEDDKVKSKEKDDKTVKKPCTTWNSSTVERKCEYEIQFEGRSCSRRHECSWCKERGKSSLHHQRSFCRLRLAAADQ